MGRNAPEKESEIVFCKNQKNSDFDADSESFSFNNSLQVKSGVVTADIRNAGPSGWITLPGILTYVTDDKTAHINFDPVRNNPGGTSNGRIVLQPFYVYGENRSKYSSTSLDQPPKITGISLTEVTISSNAYYEKLDNSGGVLLTNGRWDTARGSGYQVFLQRMTLTNTGVVLGSTEVIPDTVNIAAAGTATGNTVRFTFPSIVSDPTYTGDTKRVLVGYLGASGATSGQLCARLAEINGETITYGDPVVIRSTLSSGTFRQSIDVTYHASGEGAGCFVIATAVDPGSLSVKHSTSGEIIACNPASGLVLAGSFGTPVPFASGTTSGSATQLSCVKCAALNITDSGAGEPSIGYVYSVQGRTSSTATGVNVIQKYFVSGTTITTGSTAQISYGQATSRKWGTHIDMSGTNARYVPRLTFTSPIARSNNSGVVTITTVMGTGVNAYTSTAGSGVLAIYQVLADSGTFAFNSSRHVDLISNNNGGEGRSQGPYVISGNPYNSIYFSYFRLSPHQGGLGNGLCLELGQPLSGSSPTVSGNVSICMLTTGDYYESGIRTSQRSYNNVAETYGTFPNYPYVVTLIKGDSSTTLRLLDFGTSGERWRNAGHEFYEYISGQQLNANGSIGRNYELKMPLGKIISMSGVNPTGVVTSGELAYGYFDSHTTTGTNSVYQYLPPATLESGEIGAIVTKVALTESERRKMASSYIKKYVIIDTRNQLEEV